MQVELQQKPSAQCPELHCASDLQTLPLATVPQLPFTHGCPTHSASCAHLVAQLAPEHLNGAHETAEASMQWPLPSQLLPVTALLLDVLQVPTPQSVPLSNLRHAPCPSHRPSVPHVVAAC